MRNTNLVKIVNIITVVATFAVIMMPLVTAAQFTIPDTRNTGLPAETKVSDLLFRIINVLLGIAGLVAVIFLIVGGFRYITAGGNEETAEAAKKTILNAIIGIVVIILSFVIVSVISNALQNREI